MTFTQKLNLLFDISKTTNSFLSARIHVDPSYISKIRHGSRLLQRDSQHTGNICSIIVRRCTDVLQRRRLCEVIGAAEGSSDEQLERYVLDWLYDETAEDPVRALLNDFSSVQVAPQRCSKEPDRQGTQAFFGIDGRRQAMTSLMSFALNKARPQSLLMYSDDDSEWMDRNSTFFYEWSNMLWQIILNGGMIKVIHKVNNNINEMFDVIRRWLPFYVSGAVEAYYYPQRRDGIYKRSLTVVPGVAASFSTSIGQSSENAATFLVTDQQSVDSFTNEFFSYEALCTPLVEIHSMSSKRFLSLFQSYLESDTENIIMSNGLSLTTMSSKVIRSLELRIKAESWEILGRIHESWNNKLLKNPSGYPITHIMRLASPEDVLDGKVPIGSIGMLENTTIFYTAEEYRLQLEYILWMLDNFLWFRVVIEHNTPKGYSMHIVANREVYIFKEEKPYNIFRIRESNMVLAFVEYMHRVEHELEQDRERVKEELREYIKKLNK